MKRSNPPMDNEMNRSNVSRVDDRSRKSPARYDHIENSHVNTQGNKYVNRGITNGNTELDNSIIQPLNSSVMRDRSPEPNPNGSRRYVNQEIVRRTSIPNRTSVGTVQRVENPLSPNKTGTRVLQSRVISSNNQPSRIVQGSPQ
jgi:hypothetical protein